MALNLVGARGVIAEVDGNRNVSVSRRAGSLDEHPAVGGYYTVSGTTGAVIAAALGANTLLMSMRFSTAAGSVRAYITRLRLIINCGTVSAQPPEPVAGSLSLQRFTAVTPSGGTQRFPNAQPNVFGTGQTSHPSLMTDIRDNNAALTGSPTFGNIVAITPVPIFATTSMRLPEWVFEPLYPVVLAAGNGLAIRTGSINQAATQTWQYAYTFHWYER